MSSSGVPFPILPGSRVEMDDVVRFLTGLHAQGHPVFRDFEQSEVFYIQLNDTHRIRISVSNGRSQVQLQYLADVTAVRNAMSLGAVQEAVDRLASSVPGISWPNPPTDARLSEATPATNYATISRLIGVSQVEAVFDPYLNNKSLAELLVILSFGDGAVANGVRLLGSETTTTGKSPTFTRPGVDAWFRELGINGEARVVAKGSEHRRFMLLSSGKSLLLGHSLNAIHKNEALRLESDAQDRPFFDSTWAGAASLT